MSVCCGGQRPLGYGNEWGGSKLDQQQPPLQGLMLHSVAPTGGFTAQHPLPSWLLEGPPDSPQAQIPQVGPEGRAGGDLPQPPATFLLIFQEIPNHYWLSQKIKSINTPKLRKNKRDGVGWWHWRKSHSARPAKADNRSVPLPPFPFLIGKGPTPLPGPQGRLWPACPLKQLFFSRKTENQGNSTEAEEKQPLFGAPVVFRGPWALVAGGRPEFAVGVLSAAPPVEGAGASGKGVGAASSSLL